MILAYFGPETMMPVASVVAAALGAMMMFNRNVLLFGRNLIERVRASSAAMTVRANADASSFVAMRPIR